TAADHRGRGNADLPRALPPRRGACEEAREAEAVGMPDWFAGAVAEHYDEDTARPPVEPVVDALVDLARGGAVLELAIGTGRIALPLAQRGLSVSGIELSPDMVAQLRKKPGGAEIQV